MARLHDEPRQPQSDDEDMTATDEQIDWISDTRSEVLPVKTEGKAANLIQKIRGNPLLLGGLVVLVILAAIGGLLYWNNLQSTVYVKFPDYRACHLDQSYEPGDYH